MVGEQVELAVDAPVSARLDVLANPLVELRAELERHALVGHGLHQDVPEEVGLLRLPVQGDRSSRRSSSS